MTKEKAAKLAEQTAAVYEKLQGLAMPWRPENAEIMEFAYGTLRYVYQGLTGDGEEPAGETEEAADDVQR